MDKEKEFYILTNKSLAIAVSYAIGKDYYTYDDRYNEGKKVYSFRNTEEFQKALKTILNLRKEFIN
jgi:hypothetical protein